MPKATKPLSFDETMQRVEELYESLQEALEEDSEWTTPYGNGVNCCEAQLAVEPFVDLLREYQTARTAGLVQ